MEKVVGKFTVLFDEEDLEIFNSFRWIIHSTKQGYNRVIFDINKKRSYFHRVILGITDSSILVDHINHNPLDNRRCNLRVSDKSTNGMNRPKNKNNKSGYKGVSKSRNTWVAEIMVNGIRYREHRFKTAEEAALRYNELAIEHHKEFAVLNEIK